MENTNLLKGLKWHISRRVHIVLHSGQDDT